MTCHGNPVGLLALKVSMIYIDGSRRVAFRAAILPRKSSLMCYENNFQSFNIVKK